jgi:hypothetical protein
VHRTAILLVLVLSACGICRNEPVHTKRSPNGKLDAIVYHRHCGGSNAYSSHVSILPAEVDLASEPGNVLSMSGRHRFRVEWQGDDVLHVHGERGAVAERQFDAIGSIRIFYDNNVDPERAAAPAHNVFTEDFRRRADRSPR